MFNIFVLDTDNDNRHTDNMENNMKDSMVDNKDNNTDPVSFDDQSCTVKEEELLSSAPDEVS